MKRKLAMIILTLTLALCSILSLTACGGNNDNGNSDNPPHIHEFTALKYDTNNHWFECECGDKKDIENHKGGTATETSKAVCSVCEQEYGSLLIHSCNFVKQVVQDKYVKATAKCESKAQYYYSCACGEKGTTWFEYGEELGHSYTNYTYNNDAKCEVDGTETAICGNGCGTSDIRAKIGTALEHDFKDYISDNNATYDKDGTKTAVCNRVGCKITNTVIDIGSMLTKDDSSNNGFSWLNAGNGCGAVVPEPILPYQIDAYSTYISAEIHNATESDFYEYINSCRKYDFDGTVGNAVSPDLYYKEYNSQGYYLEVFFYKNDKRILIYVAPPKADNNDNSDSTIPNTNTKENAINDIENHADELLLEYPDDYFTPSYMRDYLIEVKGYKETIANYAIENSDIDWHFQASKEANVYLIYEEEFGQPATWWNPTDIEDILLDDGFSPNLVNSVMENIDWNRQAVKYVQHLSDFYDTFNRFEARSYLEDIVANEEGINYLLENSGINWKQHALNMANELWAEYREYEAMTLADVEDELSRIWEYTPTEIEYALNNMTI